MNKNNNDGQLDLTDLVDRLADNWVVDLQIVETSTQLQAKARLTHPKMTADLLYQETVIDGERISTFGLRIKGKGL